MMLTMWRRHIEAGGRHRGRPALRTVNEDDDFIVFHNDLVEHNTDDGLDEKKIKRNQKELKAHPQKPRRLSPCSTAGETGEEHSDRSTAHVEADRVAGEGHHARYLHSVAEAGSLVLHVSNNTNEGKQDGEDGDRR